MLQEECMSSKKSRLYIDGPGGVGFMTAWVEHEAKKYANRKLS